MQIALSPAHPENGSWVKEKKREEKKLRRLHSGYKYNNGEGKDTSGKRERKEKG